MSRIVEKVTAFIVFTLFWAPLMVLPEIIHPQDEWLEFLYKRFPPPMPERTR